MAETIELVNQYLDQMFVHGTFWVYFVIFAACFIENIFPPFPGDTFIVAAGLLTAVGRLNFLPAVSVVIVGGMSSVMVLYYFGNQYGRRYFLRKNFRIFSKEDIEKSEVQLAKRGWMLLIISRFLVGIRAAVAIVAGISQYRPLKMFLFSTLSYLLFTGLIMYLCISLVENYDQIEYYFTTYSRIVWPLVIVIVGVWLVRKFRISKEGA